MFFRNPFRSLWAGNFVVLLRFAAIAVAAVSVSAPASAQFSDSYNFLKAVKDRDGDEATKFLSRPGSVIVNTRDHSTGQTALHIVVERRDNIWLAFLLQKGANPNVADKDGVTPLILATQLRFLDGVRTLLSPGKGREQTRVDEANNQGETALIRAVHIRDAEMVRLLLANGADPDRTDTLAGKSARDYAREDRRASAILAEIEKADSDNKPETDGRFYGPQG